MTDIVNLSEAIGKIVKDGSSVIMEGFTHLIPNAAGHEIIRQNKRDLTLIKMTSDIISDQIIGCGLVKKLQFSWGGNPGVGSLHRFREAVEKKWPNAIEINERSHADMANAYVAGASKLPFAVLRGYSGTDLPKYNGDIREIECPFTGERLAAVKAIRSDVSIIHAQRADRKGNVQLWGITGVQKEAVMCAEYAIVTVEEIVDELTPMPNSIFLPSWIISAVCEEPGGTHPSYALGYTERDNRFYTDWEPISRDREKFCRWINKHIKSTESFQEFKKVYKSNSGVSSQ